MQLLKRVNPSFLLSFFTFFVIVSSAQYLQLNPTPTRILGQPPSISPSAAAPNTNPNLVEGREFDFPEGVAVDAASNPPHLYVADTGNNRVLGFQNATSFANGQKADIVIGQPDFYNTFPQGPNRQGSNRSTGMTNPIGMAVDAHGNLYVVDSGNNRILRFPAPFGVTGDRFPDLVIGQPSFSTNDSNDGGVSASSLSFSPSGRPFQAFIAFDSSGNLWTTDPANYRVLRYPAAALSGTPANGPSADLVLGQPDFVTNTLSNPNGDPKSLTALNIPTGITFDQSGNLFVNESVVGVRGRLLVYTPPFTTAKPATRLIGVVATQPLPPITSGLQFQQSSGGLFTVGNQLGIVDTLNSRLLIYNSVDKWSSDTLTQPAQIVVGQADFLSSANNRGRAAPAADSLYHPVAAFFANNELFIADSSNHRVLAIPQANGAFPAASGVLGQYQMNYNAPNLIEGKEFDFTSSGAGDAGIAIDSSSNPPHLYVADTYNNRILGYKDLRKLKSGDPADIVIGQPDFFNNLINYPTNDYTKPLTASGLYAPIGVVVDLAGNLYVADSGNARVLRFPTPFANPTSLPSADLVLGQSNFSRKITDPSASTMALPYGLAFASNNGLLVSDDIHNRVLFFAGTSATFTSGMAASIVFGQPDFTTTTAGSGDNQFNSPHHISTDTDDRLYVADTGNARVSIFNRAPQASNSAHAALVLTGVGSPRGIFVSRATGEIWVSDASNNRALRYPNYDNLIVSQAPNASLFEVSPRALALDAAGNLFVADGANRVAIHYPGVAAVNSANFIVSRPAAPGTWIAVFFQGGNIQFSSQTTIASAYPLPTTLGGVQVLLNGNPVPLYFVSPGQINFYVPMTAPTSGTADLQIVNTDTGQILGDSSIVMSTVSPALFTLPGTGSGQVAAINQDGTLNGPDHPAPNGSIVAFYGTGQGVVAGAQPDGLPAVGQTPTPTHPRVVIGTGFVDDSNITYSGLAPGLVGVWQVNVKIPDNVAPTSAAIPTPVTMEFDSIFTSDPSRRVTMWVKSK